MRSPAWARRASTPKVQLAPGASGYPGEHPLVPTRNSPLSDWISDITKAALPLLVTVTWLSLEVEPTEIVPKLITSGNEHTLPAPCQAGTVGVHRIRRTRHQRALDVRMCEPDCVSPFVTYGARNLIKCCNVRWI